MTDEQIIAELDLSEGVPDLQQRIVGNVRHVVEQRVIGLVTEMIQGEQEQEFERLGSNKLIQTDVRLIAGLEGCVGYSTDPDAATF